MTAVERHGAAELDADLSASPNGDVVVVISPFAGFGRLAHLRRELLALPSVRGVRIQGYGRGEARFVVDLHDEASPRDLAIPGTRVRSVSDTAVSLAVISSVAAS